MIILIDKLIREERRRGSRYERMVVLIPASGFYDLLKDLNLTYSDEQRLWNELKKGGFNYRGIRMKTSKTIAEPTLIVLPTGAEHDGRFDFQSTPQEERELDAVLDELRIHRL